MTEDLTLKVKLITTVSNPNHTGFLMLKKSLEKFGWDWEICGTEYYAFGSKMVNAYNYAKTTDCTHLFIVDAYDVVVLSTMDEALCLLPKDAIVFNSEKNAWPYEQWAMLYPYCDGPWKYLNGGVAFVEVKRFIDMFEENPILHTDNDQVILAKTFLTAGDRHNMFLDNTCMAFQTLCGLEASDLSFINNRVKNNIFGTEPIFVHGNGLHPMDDFYELLK